MAWFVVLAVGVSDNGLGLWFVLTVTCWIADCWLKGVVLVSCGCIWSVYARRNDAGTMISVVLSYMWFVVEWCPECCSRCSISSIILGGVVCEV